MTIFGIDVSGWQGSIDWPAVRGAGIDFAIIKATEGNSYTDSRWASNARNAVAAKIPVVGAYHWLHHHGTTHDASSEADYFVSRCREAWGDLDDKVLVVDIEETTPAPDRRDIDTFVARFRELEPTHPLVVYTGGWWWRPRFPTWGSHIGPLWESHYIDPPHTSPQAAYPAVPASWWTPGYGGWKAASILQFSSSCTVRGISGRVDANAFRGTVGDLRRLTWDSSVIIPPDTSTGGDNVNRFAVPKVPQEAYIPKGTWIYDNSDLAPSKSNINIDPGRWMPYIGIPAGTRAVEYVGSDGVHSGMAYYFHADAVKQYRNIVTDDGITQATVDAAVAAAQAEAAKAAAQAEANHQAALEACRTAGEKALAELAAKQDALIEQAITDTIAEATVEHTIRWNR